MREELKNLKAAVERDQGGKKKKGKKSGKKKKGKVCCEGKNRKELKKDFGEQKIREKKAMNERKKRN